MAIFRFSYPSTGRKSEFRISKSETNPNLE